MQNGTHYSSSLQRTTESWLLPGRGESSPTAETEDHGAVKQSGFSGANISGLSIQGWVESGQWQEECGPDLRTSSSGSKPPMGATAYVFQVSETSGSSMNQSHALLLSIICPALLPSPAEPGCIHCLTTTGEGSRK